MSRESKEQLAAELIRLAREHEAANDAFDEVAAQKLGVNRTDLRCLNIIENERGHEGSMTAGRLAQLTGLTSAAVTAVLDRLEKAGYARRVRDQKDRRQVLVELTPLIAERGEQIWGPLGRDAQAAFARRSVEELKSVIEYLRSGRDLNVRHVERVRALRFE
jgi:DNA-binding MarR family transcriptional regulator